VSVMLTGASRSGFVEKAEDAARGRVAPRQTKMPHITALRRIGFSRPRGGKELGGCQPSEKSRDSHNSDKRNKEAFMSFVTIRPEALAYAAGKLQTLGSAMAAESAAVASPTTGVIPAAADEVSAMQAAIFAAYGTLYQSVNAQATAIHELFVNTLGASAGSYLATESANSATTASSFSQGISGLLNSAANAAAADPPGANIANLLNIGGGNWGSASSDLLDMVQGGILPAANEGGDIAGNATGVADGLDGTVPTGAAAPAGSAGLGGVPMLGGLGQAASAGGLSVPPSWAAGAAPAVANPGAITTAGWTAPAPQSTPVTTMPAAMPAVATAGKAAGLGAPRYGVKPTVMGRPAVV
jgi:PPE-repeat protein